MGTFGNSPASKKRSYRFGEYVSDVWDCMKRMPAFAGVYMPPGKMDESFREKIMLSVSRMNQCRHCTAIHGSWASLAGLSEEEKAMLADMNPEDFEHAEWVALEYARRLVAGGADEIDQELIDEMNELYSPEELKQIEAVSKGINIANKCGNTWDVFLERLKGNASEDSSLSDELLVLLTLLPVGPFFLLVSAMLQRKENSRKAIAEEG